jgi:hypothetical protein
MSKLLRTIAVVNSGYFNMTSVGTGDWFAYSGAAEPTRKNSVNSLVVEELGSAIPMTYGTGTSFNMTWTDGPGGTEGSATGYAYINGGGAGTGMRITAAAGVGTRKLVLYCAIYETGLAVDAVLSDGSVVLEVDSSAYNDGHAGINYIAITIEYAAASAGQTLHVDLVQTTGNGSLSMLGAAMSAEAIEVVDELAPILLSAVVSNE